MPARIFVCPSLFAVVYFSFFSTCFFEKSCPNLTKGLLSSAGLTKIDGNTAKGAFTMDQDKINILRIFQLDGTPVSCKDYGSGHVNVTFLVVTDTGRRYILQKINHHAFRNVQALSENIAAVTDFLRSKSSDPRSVMSLIRTKDGAPPHPVWGRILARIRLCGRDDLPSAARRRTRISIKPPSVSVRLRSCSPTFRRKSCTRPSRIFTTRPIAAAFSARRSSATRWPRRGRSAGDRFCSCKGSGDVHAPELSFCRRDPAPRCAQRHEAQQRPSGREDTKGALRCRSGHRDARAQASLISATPSATALRPRRRTSAISPRWR